MTGERFGQWFWCTITAPGVEEMPWDESQCNHDPEVKCSGRMGCRVDRMDAAVWNGTASRRWSWFMTYVRRRIGEQVQFCGVWEYQERGVLHRHFLLRIERPTTQKRVSAAVRNSGRRWGFGRQFDVQAITGDAAMQAWYVAKYAGKTVDSIHGSSVLDVKTGELKASRGFRAWSCSRQWGDSMRSVKARQVAFQRGLRAGGASRSSAAGPGAGGALDPNSDISTPDPSDSSLACSVPRSSSLL